MPRTHRTVITTVAALALWAAPAAAHPSFDPNQVPGGEPVEARFVIPHGCGEGGGMPHDGGGLPTQVVELQLPEAVIIFDAHPVAGWVVTREENVVRWSADGRATTEPLVFDVTFSVAGSADETVYLAAYQGCDGGEFRWIGTPDAEAEYPAVSLTLSSAADLPTPEPAGTVASEETTVVASPDVTVTPAEQAVSGSVTSTSESGSSGQRMAVLLLLVAAGVAAAVLVSRRMRS